MKNEIYFYRELTGIKILIQKKQWSIITVIFCVIFLLCSCNANSSRNQQKTLSDTIIIPAVVEEISQDMSFIGNIEYKQSETITWKTNGMIDFVQVRIGDKVKKGDILAALNPESVDSEVISAEISLLENSDKLEDLEYSRLAEASAYVTLLEKEAELKNAKLEQEALYYPRATTDEINRAWDDYALSNLNFNYAKQDYDYLVSINEPWEGSEEGYLGVSIDDYTDIPAEEYGIIDFPDWEEIPVDYPRPHLTGVDKQSGRERKLNEYISAYDTMKNTYDTYIWVSGQPTDNDYAVAEGNVSIAQLEYSHALDEYLSYQTIPREKDIAAVIADLNSAEATYNKRFIIAEFDGTVTALKATEGYYVQKNDIAIRLDDTSKVCVPVYIPELDSSKVKKGTPSIITIDAIPDRVYSGSIEWIDSSSDKINNITCFRAAACIDNVDNQILAGMTAEVNLPNAASKMALSVPNSAISFDQGIAFVTVSDSIGVHKVQVELGLIGNTKTEILSGIQEGTMVVIPSL